MEKDDKKAEEDQEKEIEGQCGARGGGVMSFFSTHLYLFSILFANEIRMGYSKLVQSRFQICLDSPSLPAAQIMKYVFLEDTGPFPSLPLLLLKFLIFIDFLLYFQLNLVYLKANPECTKVIDFFHDCIFLLLA